MLTAATTIKIAGAVVHSITAHLGDVAFLICAVTLDVDAARFSPVKALIFILLEGAYSIVGRRFIESPAVLVLAYSGPTLVKCIKTDSILE
jgi:hypothetical protein